MTDHTHRGNPATPLVACPSCDGTGRLGPHRIAVCHDCWMTGRVTASKRRQLEQETERSRRGDRDGRGARDERGSRAVKQAERVSGSGDANPAPVGPCRDRCTPVDPCMWCPFGPAGYLLAA